MWLPGTQQKPPSPEELTGLQAIVNAKTVDARVTAQLLRNTPVLGSVMSVVLWPVSKIFECQVTGKLSDPVVKPVYMPAKLLLVPLHPIRTLEELFSSPATNAPATNSIPVLKPNAPAN